ncbi:MAG TPA: hypothetical protein VII69_11545 [Candidatus Eremiobacteraceae bacterium]
MNTIFSSFADWNDAKRAVGALLDHGALKDDIDLVANEKYSLSENGTQRPEGGSIDAAAKQGVTVTTGSDAASGAAKGAGVGLAVGVAAGLISILVPGVGIVIGAGALATAAAAAAGTTAAGAIAGGMTGYLADQGVPADAVSSYQETVKNGGALLALRVPSHDLSETGAFEILAKYGGKNNVYGVPV